MLSNTAGDGSGSGGGLCLNGIHGQVNDNIIEGNIGGQSSGGDGGGAFIMVSDATVHGNTIKGNIAGQTGSHSCGGGLDIFASNLTCSANTIIGNKASGDTCTTEWGGGIFLSTAFGDITTNLVNNIVAQNEAAEGAGIYILNYGSGYAPNFGANLYHNTIADNNGDGVRCCAGGSTYRVTLTMTNDIVSSHNMGVSATDGVDATIDHSLFFNNADNGIVGTNPVYGDPAFVGGENYHISATSAAINAGVDAGVTTDIDGQTRPWIGGYDIGADEYTPGITVTPRSLNFSDVIVGEDSAPQAVTITNDGDADLTINSISITGADASEFSQTNDCPGTLSPGASCTVNVVFSPSSEGAKSASLTIQSDDSASGTVNVALSGTGGVAITGVVLEVNCNILLGVTITLYKNGEVESSVGNDNSGNYTLPVPEAGECEVVASKDGFKDRAQDVTVAADPVTLDFVGETGLIPLAASMSYVLTCVNHWLYPVGDCGLTMSTVLAVVNAWLYPQPD